MNVLILTRTETSKYGTFGRLLGFHSGELQDLNNQPNISCVPCGTFDCIMTFSPHMKIWTYQLLGVPNRSEIRIHSANFMGSKADGLYCQLNGCISLGEKLGTMDGQKAILVSRPAITKFENMMKGQPFKLEIKSAFANN